jgi:hypothetical protein
VVDFFQDLKRACVLATQLLTRPISLLVLCSNLNLIFDVEINLPTVLVRLLAIIFLCFCHFRPREFPCILNVLSILLCVPTV